MSWREGVDVGAQVNLLPREASARAAAARQRGLLMAGAGVLALALGGVTWLQAGTLSDAEDALAAEEQVAAELRQEEAGYAEFSDLERRQAEATSNLQAALSTEVSFAGLLQDVASVIPADTELHTLQATLGQGPTVSAMGTLVVTGRTANDHAPGLERVLRQLDKLIGLHDLYVTDSHLESPDHPYPTFTVEASLGVENLTGRYLLGLPEELR